MANEEMQSTTQETLIQSYTIIMDSSDTVRFGVTSAHPEGDCTILLGLQKLLSPAAFLESCLEERE